jgi:hypothetical protein
MNERERRRHRKMMSRGMGRPVDIVSSRERTRGEVRILSLAPSGRVARAAKMLALMWALAIVSILVPGLHFILVPGFLVAGPVLAFKVARERSVVLGGEGTCPACGQFVQMPRGAEEWPQTDVCLHCQAFLRIEELQVSSDRGGWSTTPQRP